MNELLTFTIISALLVASPGPNGVLLIKTISSYGKKHAYVNIFGLVTATFVHGALSIFGLSALILSSSELFIFFKLIGASYLLYIGIKTIYNSFENKNNKQESELKINNNKKEGKISSSFIEGFFTQVLNPKVSMFYLAAFPQFIDFKQAAYLDAFVLVSIHAFLITIWFYFFANLLVKMKKVSKSSSKINTYIQRISGTIFVLFAGLLLTQENSK